MLSCPYFDSVLTTDGSLPGTSAVCPTPPTLHVPRPRTAAPPRPVTPWRRVKRGFVRAVASRVNDTRTRLNASIAAVRALEEEGRVRLSQPWDDFSTLHPTRYELAVCARARVCGLFDNVLVGLCVCVTVWVCMGQCVGFFACVRRSLSVSYWVGFACASVLCFVHLASPNTFPYGSTRVAGLSPGSATLSSL